MIWDEGFWMPLGDMKESLERGSLKFLLAGIRLKGKWALVRTQREKSKQDNWLLFKERDEYAKDTGGISDYTVSVRTGRTMEEIGGV